MKQIIGEVNQDLPLSEGVKCGDLLFVSGQTPPRNDKGEIEGNNIEEQTRMVIDKIVKIVKTAGGNIDDIVKTTVFIKDMALFQRMNKVYSEMLKPNPPARSCFEVKLVDESLVEIEAIAYIPEEK